MTMTLKAAYDEVQRRKEVASFEEWPPSLVPVVAQVAKGIRQQLGTNDPRIIEHTLVGMAWVVAMLHDEDLDVAEAMDVPVALATNVLANVTPDLMLRMTARQSVELGIGAGFYTGLQMGLVMRGES